MLLPFPIWLWLVQIPLHHNKNMENSIRSPPNCLSSRFCILSCHEQVLWGPWHSNHRGPQISHLETEIDKPNKHSHDSDRCNYPGGHDCILRGCFSHPNQWNWILHVSFVMAATGNLKGDVVALGTCKSLSSFNLFAFSSSHRRAGNPSSAPFVNNDRSLQPEFSLQENGTKWAL